MKKTISSNIGGRNFYIEDDAYDALAQYLAEIKSHFAGYDDHEEIVADIENRIAEQFMQLGKKSPESIVQLSDVESVIATMGSPSDFMDTEEKTEPKSNQDSKKHGKLYRNPDDKIISGVAGGLAAFFGIDAIWIRLIFVITALFSGYGILLYIIIWIIVPEAETPSEKLKMKGDPITLASVEQSVKEKIIDNEKAKNGVRKVGSIIETIFRKLGKIVGIFFQVISRIIGAAVSVGSAAALLGLLVLGIVLVRSGSSPQVDFPLRDFFSAGELYAVVFSGFFTAFVPVLIVGLIGTTLLLFKSVFNKPITLALLVVWFIAAGIFASTIINAAPRFEEFRQTHPAFKIEVKQIEVKDFTKISAENDLRIEVKQGPEFSVQVEAMARDQEQIRATVENGVLKLGKENGIGRVCIFCVHQTARIIVTAPNIDELRGANAARFDATGLTSEKLELVLENASRATVSISAGKVLATTQNGSHIELSGTATEFMATAQNGSRIEAGGLISKSVKAFAQNGSKIQVFAEERLESKAQNGSRIYYDGTPEIIEGNAKRDTNEEAYDIQPIAPSQPTL